MRRNTAALRRQNTLKRTIVLCAGVLMIGAVAILAGWYLNRDEALFVRDAQGRIVAIRALQQEETETLAFASAGEDVTQLQQRLADYGYYEGEPTGFYGTQTAHAVQDFQYANGLAASGLADEATCNLLMQDTATACAVYEQMVRQEEEALARGESLVTAMTYAPNALSGSAQVEVWDARNASYVEFADGQAYATAQSDAQGGSTVDPDNLKLGDENERVAQIQTRLNELGYYVGATVSNYYGTMTQTAIFNFQKANGMTPDGVCGTQTQNLLFSDGAVTFDAYLAAGGVEYSQRDEVIAQLIAYAKNYLGCPYVWAGAGPYVFDCSGYTMYIYRHFGYSFGHGCSVQSNALGEQLGVSQLLPGDIVFFDTNGGHNSLEHVGIYIGDGQFIHASSGGGRVMINSLTSGYYSSTFMWGKRVIPL